MPDTISPLVKERLADQPDMNKNAPRPAHIDADDEPVSTMDAVPRAERHDQPGFDQAVAAEDIEASDGTLPGTDEYDKASRASAQHHPDKAAGDGDISNSTDHKAGAPDAKR